MLKSIAFGALARLFSSWRQSDRVYFGWCVWDSVWGSLGCNLRDNQSRLTRASVLLARLSVLASQSTSLSAGNHVWVQAVPHDLFSSGVFLPYFSMLILLLPLLGLASKFTCLSPRFCVHRRRYYDTICWNLNLISGFFVFFRLFVWANGINKCWWCLAGGRGCWLKGRHHIPSVSWIFHLSSNFHIY